MSPALMANPTTYAAREMALLQSVIPLTDPGNIFLDRDLLVVRAFQRMPQHLIQQKMNNAEMHYHSLSNISPLAQNNVYLAGANVYLWTTERPRKSNSQVTPVIVSRKHLVKESFITFKSADYARAVIAWTESDRIDSNKGGLKAVIVTNPFYAIKLHNYLTSLIYVK